jgi:ATP-dependent RNA helicase DDX51/DBP6
VQAKRLKLTLPWLEVPIATAPENAIRLSSAGGMHPALQHALRTAGFPTLFPIQAVAWHVTAGGMSTRHDLCIAAPTGSGKTLAYVLPMLQRCLEEPNNPGLMGLLVLPTRALAEQVASP